MEFINFLKQTNKKYGSQNNILSDLNLLATQLTDNNCMSFFYVDYKFK